MTLSRMRVTAAACAVGGATAVVLAACGSSSTSSSSPASSAPARSAAATVSGQPAGSASASTRTTTRTTSELISQMKAAVKSASSVHVAGQLVGSGKSVALNLGLHRSGDLAGTITNNGTQAQVLSANGKVYAKATKALLQRENASGAACALLCGKYLELPAAQASALTGGLSMSKLTGSVSRQQPGLTQQGVVTVDGQSAIVLRGADGSTLDVAANGPAYPLRVVARGVSKGVLTYSQWNKVPMPTAPPSGQVVNINQLKAGTS